MSAPALPQQPRQQQQPAAAAVPAAVGGFIAAKKGRQADGGWPAGSREARVFKCVSTPFCSLSAHGWFIWPS